MLLTRLHPVAVRSHGSYHAYGLEGCPSSSALISLAALSPIRPNMQPAQRILVPLVGCPQSLQTRAGSLTLLNGRTLPMMACISSMALLPICPIHYT